MFEGPKFSDSSYNRQLPGKLFDRFSRMYTDTNFDLLEGSWRRLGFGNNKGGWIWSDGKNTELSLLFPEVDHRRMNELERLMSNSYSWRDWARGIPCWDEKTAAMVIARQVEEPIRYFSGMYDREILFPFGDKFHPKQLDEIRNEDAPWVKNYLNHDGRMLFQQTSEADPKAFRFATLWKTSTSRLMAGVAKGGFGFTNFESPAFLRLDDLGVSGGAKAGSHHLEFLLYEFDYFHLLEAPDQV